MNDGNKILKLTGIFLTLVGIATLIIGIIAFSNAGKTNDSIRKVQALQSSSTTTSYSAASSSMQPLKDWAGKAKTYSIIMMAVSAMHIIFGIIGFLMAEKSENAMLCVGFGALMLLGAAGAIIYPLVVNDKAYDLAQAFMDAFYDPSDRKDNRDYWCDFGIGLKCCHISLNALSRDGFLRAGLWYPSGKYYEKLHARREEIEQSFAEPGIKFVWAKVDEDTKGRWFYLSKDYDYDEASWSEAYAWLEKMIMRLRTLALEVHA